MSLSIKAWAASAQGSHLEQASFPRNNLHSHELLIEVSACGICHSDIHLIDNDWKISKYPLAPGHEIIGRIVEKGKQVPEHFKIGSIVGVGWQRSACHRCLECLSNRDQMCDKIKATCVGHPGGFADYHVTDWQYSFLIPENLQVPQTAPLLCGGITVFSPLQMLVPQGGQRVGIVGLGGLGHFAVKFAKAKGYEVTVFTSSESKKTEAKKLGATHVVSSTNPKEIKAMGPYLDFMLVTANVDLPWEAYLQALQVDGVLCFVGIPPNNLSINVGSLLGKRRKITASPIGSRYQIQEMLEFCSHHQITAQAEIFSMDKANEALLRVRENLVRYRAVLVHSSLDGLLN